LITGAHGSLGTELQKRLAYRSWGGWNAAIVTTTDIDTMDVRDWDSVARVVRNVDPDVIFHLAGAKHAPLGEVDPFGVAETNISGTEHMIDAAESCGARVVLASTCKACDPETAYGATKLIAERMVLNACGSVARFYNVPETCGNVFELWRNLPEDEPLPVTPCSRYFISAEQAIDLLLWCAVLPSGRYCADPGRAKRMSQVAAELYPGRPQRRIPPRRGDRLREPRFAAGEVSVPVSVGLEAVFSPHDPAREPTREEVVA
jgi:FlaA1/EpsC-like NDP-sugar epimerase